MTAPKSLSFLKLVGCFLLLMATAPAGAQPRDIGTFETEATRIRVEALVEGLERPSTLEFLPDGGALFADRNLGQLNILDLDTAEVTSVAGVPAVFNGSGGGLFDVLLHPDYAENGWIYLSYGEGTEERNTLVVDRARLDGARLVDRQRLFTAQPYAPPGYDHFGGRIEIKDGYLFITMGDRTEPMGVSQDLSNHFGSIMRLHDDGRVPEDNPFAGQEGALPEIWSFGHRNPQGLVFHPETGELWEHEHGPKGGDEINIIRPGVNYGWPVITYGIDYDDTPIGDGITEMEGMAQPLHYYVPSIAPSGMDFYYGNAFPAWRGNLFIGAMALTHLNRLVISDGEVIHEERIFDDQDWRVRFVRAGPDGFLYLGVDGGMILRLTPAG